MCGITGFFDPRPGERDERRAVLHRMNTALRHRGPDGDGLWQDAQGMVNLGHRRLAILDLTPTGAQPMATGDGRHVITFNGEIYNFAELRGELEHVGCRFHGTSDTEVLLQALRTWGVEPTLRRLNGMFAFAYWDGVEQALYLARDRFGEKPVYYGWHGGTFLFGSELKALACHPRFSREVDHESLALFMRFNYVPWPHSIFRNTWKLGPGHFLRIADGQMAEPKPYWRLAEVIPEHSRPANDQDLVGQLDQALRKAVKLRMVADVPLGAFLSGGIDSSIIVAMMQVQAPRPVKTFTIGFWETPYNEGKDAARVARHLGTEHHEIYLSSRECTEVIVRLPEIYDEPFADSSQIPTTLVSEFTRRHVTVALSGDAGDELFGGYNRYFWTRRIWPRLRALPPGLRRLLAQMIQTAGPQGWDRAFEILNHCVPGKLQVRGGGEKLHKLAKALDAQNTDELYRGFVSQWHQPQEVLLQGKEPRLLDEHLQQVPAHLHYVERMMYMDTLTYLPSDILCKVDRASMSCGLEARVPFLDPNLAELAWSIPLDTKIRNGVAKWPLRQVLARYVPPKLFERPKAGFGIPIGDWMRGPMRAWVEEALSERRLTQGGYFRADVVRAQWLEHLSGRRNNQHALWGVIMFQEWLSKNIEGR